MDIPKLWIFLSEKLNEQFDDEFGDCERLSRANQDLEKAVDDLGLSETQKQQLDQKTQTIFRENRCLAFAKGFRQGVGLLEDMKITWEDGRDFAESLLNAAKERN